MNDDLNASLHRAVDSALDEALSAEQMRRSVAERVRAKRRRRPALLLGATLGSLALVGGTAFAAVQLAKDDTRRNVPDVLAPRPEVPLPSPSTAAAVPSTEPTTVPDLVATLAVADPEATGAQCGALIDRGSTSPEDATSRILVTTSTDLATLTAPGESSLALSLDNRELSTISGVAEAAVTLVIVKDGVVVGRAPDAAPDTEPYELAGSEEREIGGTLWVEPCGPDAGNVGQLPAGRYEVWSIHRYTVTARTFMQADFTQGNLVPVDESYDSRLRLDYLWVDETGQPTQKPYEAAGMPSAIDTVTAMAGVTSASVVWLALPTDPQSTIDTASATTTELGYGDALWPFMCQGAASDAFGPDETGRSGVALVFATRGEAESFTEIYDGGVAGIVDGDVFCHFD